MRAIHSALEDRELNEQPTKDEEEEHERKRKEYGHDKD